MHRSSKRLAAAPAHAIPLYGRFMKLAGSEGTQVKRALAAINVRTPRRTEQIADCHGLAAPHLAFFQYVLGGFSTLKSGEFHDESMNEKVTKRKD